MTGVQTCALPISTGYATAAIALGLGAVWFAQSPARPGNQPLATTPPPVATTNQADLVNPSHTSPTGLFNTPSLQVQPVDFKK